MEKRKRVLIVEEEASFRCRLASAVRNLGFEAIEAGDAFEAFQKISNLSEKGLLPDLLVIAVQMKVVSGAALLDRLEKFCLPIPVVFTSYFMDESLFAGLMRRQCVDFIEMPAPPAKVATRIAAILHGKDGDRLPPRVVFRRKGGDAMIVEWSRPGPEGRKGGCATGSEGPYE